MESDIEIDFYYNVGILSTKFAVAEQYAQDILCLLISRKENDINTITLIEEYSLWKTLNTLTKINRRINNWEEEIFEIIKRLDKTRIIRNLFIHGLWKSPRKEGERIIITVETKKIKYKEHAPYPEQLKSDYPYKYSSREWSFNDHKTFTLDQIKGIISEITKIIKLQESLIFDMKEKLEL